MISSKGSVKIIVRGFKIIFRQDNYNHVNQVDKVFIFPCLSLSINIGVVLNHAALFLVQRLLGNM